MASYWKSPYKEKTQPVTYSQTYSDRSSLDTFIPLGSRNYCGLNKIRYAGPISPQDWFNWALAINSNGLKPNNSNVQYSNVKIKGILKSTGDTVNGSDTERTAIDVESVASLISDSVASKKEKKRVTFGENHERECTPNHRLLSERLAATFSNKPMNAPRTEEIAKETPKPPAFQNSWESCLPSISGTSIAATEPSATTPRSQASRAEHKRTNTLSSCKHSPDLRCASCVTFSSGMKSSQTTSTTELRHLQETIQRSSKKPIVSQTMPRTISPFDATKQNMEPRQLSHHEKTAGANNTEPLKRYKPHWSKSFFRAQKKRQQVRLANRKNPFTPRSLQMTNADPITNADISEQLSRLHISGDGKMVPVKLDAASKDISPNSKLYPVASQITPQRTQISNVQAESITGSTYSPRLKAGLKRGSSAPSRLKEVTHTSYADPANVDKTSQIISWLNDVKSVNQSGSKKARAYPSGQSHLRQ